MTRPSPEAKTHMDAIKAMHQWHADVAAAAEPFERRWTMRALKRVDPDIAQRLDEQIHLFHQVKITGDANEIAEHGAATCRGWQAAVAVMEAAKEPDDAYCLGFDAASGVRVAIGDQVCAASRVAEIHGEKVIWITPDEVATLFATIENFKGIEAIKRIFPGAEIVNVHTAEAAE